MTRSRISCQWDGRIFRVEHAFAFPLRPKRDPNPPPQKMVASRKDLADAIQSYSDNDNHPEKMGNRQPQYNSADVAAFPKE